MRHHLHRFLALDVRRQSHFIHAWFALGVIRLTLFTLSFKYLAAPLHHHREIPRAPAVPAGQLAAARELGRLVAVAARHTPWCSSCLVQVLALQRLLRARGIPGQFHLGVRRHEAIPLPADHTSPALAAHAWLRCGDAIVNGELSHRDYTVISTFSW